jgi:hypothetical protein
MSEAEGAGPRIRQLSNAYRRCIPAFARVIVERIIGSAPTPADVVQHDLLPRINATGKLARQMKTSDTARPIYRGSDHWGVARA